MEDHSYVSCIKINGVPILPPLMTDNIRAEMNYYKQLAIAVEEKLKILEMSKQAETDMCAEKLAQECKVCGDQIQKKNSYSSSSDDCTAATETSTINSVHDDKTVIDLPTKENTCSESLRTSISESTATNHSCKSLEDDDETKDELFITSMCSDTVSVCTDLNQYLDISPPTQHTVAPISPEFTKPQVPKTLDIIPIVVDLPRINEDTTPHESRSLSTPQKLVRQGSYVLETPSPMLLAHMQTEISSESNYIPTTANTAPKRKEWNISQAKSEWENQVKSKELVIPENSKHHLHKTRYRRNSISCVNNQRVNKSFSQSKNSTPFRMEHSTRSVDCIRTMLVKEFSREIVPRKANDISHRESIIVNGTSQIDNSYKSKSSKNVAMLNLANKFGGSLGTLNHSTIQTNCTSNTKSVVPQKTTEQAQNSSTPRTTAASAKLVTIFKEIQKKHEEQMAELISKQQKEQNNMQREFEKQQILLLSQIKKTFPNISMPESIEIIPKITSITSPHLSDLKFNTDSTQKKDYDVYQADGNTFIASKCPLDYIYSMNGECHISSCQNTNMRTIHSTKEQNSPNEICLTNNSKTANSRAEKNIIIDDKMMDYGNKYLNVSRQLFPLNGHTVHVPVPTKTRYTEKHIRAATVINAYARGYLVRRLMKTERVISLKNTYKEALQCMLKLHIDAPLNLPELNFHQRLQLQCDAASMNIVELFAQSASERMQIICQDREIKRSRPERPTSAHSYSFATQRTLARKKMKEMGDYPSPPISRPCSARTRCQTWASNARERRVQNTYHGIKRSTSAGTVRKPWR